MLRIRDYTRLKPGTKFEGNDIVECEHCGKPSLLELASGKKFYTHSETLGFDDNGKEVMEWVWCPRSEALHAKPPATDEGE